MRVATSSFPDSFLYQTNRLQNQQNTLQSEATTGLKLTMPEDDPAAMSQALQLQSDSSANTQYQSNITQLQDAATTSYDAMNGLQTLISKANEIASSVDGTTSATEMSSYASEIGGIIQQAVQLANTKDSQGNYIYGGTKMSSPPFAATTDATGNITAVNYQGNSSVAQSEISPGVTVTAQTLGANSSGSGPRGLITDSRYGADLFNHLISLQSDLNSGNAQAVTSVDAPQISKDVDNIAYQVGSNGVMQSTLSNTSSVATQQSANLTTQMSNTTSADLATTLTRLQQTQTSFQAALQSGVLVMQLSLLQFLP